MEIKVRNIYEVLDHFAPFVLQEEWDNSGFQFGSLEKPVSAVLLALDVTEDAVKAASKVKADLIISHHPLFFRPLKSINFSDSVISLLSRGEISVISSHTPLDLIPQGVSYTLAKCLDLEEIKVLVPKRDSKYCKLSFFITPGYEKGVLEQLFDNGVGEYNLYNHCAFAAYGEGRFQEKEGASPFVKSANLFKEMKVELLVREDKLISTVEKLKEIHPYDEVAFDVFQEKINTVSMGYGCIGTLQRAKKLSHFLEDCKMKLGLSKVRFVGDLNGKIKKVALCGGSGGTFIHDAIRAKADVYLTGDLKYHELLENRGSISFVDVGHRASELPVLGTLKDLLINKFQTLKIYQFVEHKDFFSYY